MKLIRLRYDKPALKVIKQARWLLLRNPQDLKTPEQQVRLEDLLAANQTLMTVYLMKAELKDAELLASTSVRIASKVKAPP